MSSTVLSWYSSVIKPIAIWSYATLVGAHVMYGLGSCYQCDENVLRCGYAFDNARYAYAGRWKKPVYVGGWLVEGLTSPITYPMRWVATERDDQWHDPKFYNLKDKYATQPNDNTTETDH